MTEQQEWKAYLERYIKAYNALPEVPPLLKTIDPLLFNYQITDRPEMSYWEANPKWMALGLGLNNPEGFAELSQIQFAKYQA
jgi:hypothetical protein